MLKVGDNAPEFKLPDQNGKIHNLTDYKDGYVLVYFYPKDDTPGCTKEACGFRDNLPHFENLDLTVIGISADSVNSHKKFADKHNLPFTILADEEKVVVKDYGVWKEKSFMGRKFMGVVRSSFLIDKNGKIVKVYEKVNPAKHPTEVLKDLQNLSG